MSWVLKTVHSSLGKKYLMALTGFGLLGFLIGHISGNVLVFFGQDAINAYAVGLRELPLGLLWILRGGILVMFVLHIYFGIVLKRDNAAARPIPYASNNTIQASFASRSMIYSGFLVLFFLLYHLAHFTFHVVNNTGQKTDALGRHDVYTMVIEGFQQPLISISYILAMLVLGLHLSHGLSSMFQSVGINHPKYNALLRKIGPVVGWGLAALYISIPVAVWFGFVGV